MCSGDKEHGLTEIRLAIQRLQALSDQLEQLREALHSAERALGEGTGAVMVTAVPPAHPASP